MLVYSVFMFIFSAIFIVLAAMVYSGRTDLIHDYHQSRVSDKAAYGKSFGKAMFIVAAAPLLSGITALFGASRIILGASVSVLLIGLGVGLGCIVKVQKKYNGGIF